MNQKVETLNLVDSVSFGLPGKLIWPWPAMVE